MKNSLGQALAKKMTGAVDYVTGTRHVDNETNPYSALNMARRKAASKVSPMQRALQNKVGKNSTGVGVGY